MLRRKKLREIQLPKLTVEKEKMDGTQALASVVKFFVLSACTVS